MVFDLEALELEVENAPFYELSSCPTRPTALSTLRLSIHQKDAKAAILLDDVSFLRDLPESLRPHLQQP